MVIVQGVFKMAPADREAFLEQSREQMEISRGEQGCLEYVLAADPLEADRVILSERWESTEDLAAHATALTAKRSEGAAPPRLQPTSHEITVYEVTSSQSMG